MGKKKEKKDIKSIIITVCFMVVIFLVTFLGFGFIGKILVQRILENDLSFQSFIIEYIIVIISSVVVFYLHIIFHEAGHLIFGLMSDYEFISFRVGSLTIIKEDEKFKIKKFNIKGTAGQCLMMPKTDNYKEVKYKLYNLGGVLMNIILTSISLLALLAFEFDINIIIEYILIISIIFGIIFIITNGVPIKLGGIANDGYNILAISKDDFIKYCFYIQLKVNGLLSKGIRVKDMPIEWFYLKDGTDLNNPIVTALKIMECGYYVDNLNFEAAQRCYEEILEKSTNIIKVYEYEIKCELLFFEILKGNIDKIEEIYTKELRNYIKATKFHISRKRLMYAYNLLVLKDKEKAEKSLIEFEKVKKSYPIKGEILMEEDVVNFIRNTNSAKMV